MKDSTWKWKITTHFFP